MRIQTRLFLGTAILVLVLTAVQWWLHQRQLDAVESELSAVATAVGRDLIAGGPEVVVRRLAEEAGAMEWVSDGGGAQARDLHVVVVPEDVEARVTHRVSKTLVRRPSPAAGATAGTADGEVEVRVQAEVVADRLELAGAPDSPAPAASPGQPAGAKRFVLQVVATDDGPERFLVVSGDGGQLQRIPIPVEPAVRTFRSTMQRGALVSGLVLAVGLVGAAVLANRVARPLRRLADGAESVGRGALGTQVAVTATGEIGELQRAFNAMSTRLAELEGEREAWRRREHLAQLGDLSRGLAHTLRNPLNTLGLALEELAGDDDSRRELVATARSQIRRIDQWLRSFLALGAEDAAEPTLEDLGDLVREVVFAAVQQGAPVELDAPDRELAVRVVPTAVRAALANLVENAAEANAAGSAVEVAVRREDGFAVVSIRDCGPGLPEDVRRRLFEPHVTTKVGGSGMGLFLARQLLVGMHDGVLEIADDPRGGTMATVKLPLADPEPPRDT